MDRGGGDWCKRDIKCLFYDLYHVLKWSIENYITNKIADNDGGGRWGNIFNDNQIKINICN